MAEKSVPASGSSRSSRPADARSLALRILRRMREAGGRAAPLLAALRRHGVPERELGLATEILYGALRWRSTLDAVVRRLSRRRPPPPEIADILHLALYQILFLDRVPAHAAVSRAVDQARALGGAPAARFANALLREACRRGATLLEPAAGQGEAAQLAHRLSHPEWLVQRWLARFERASVEALLSLNQQVPEVSLWPSPDRGDTGARLREEGARLEPARFVPGAWRARGGALQFSQAHARGEFVIQDEASQLVVWMLDRPLRGPILDMCAGSGGKSAQMLAAAAPGAWLLAADRSRRSLRALRTRVSRLRLPRPALLRTDWQQGRPLRERFAVVLLDAPCTGTGVLRRRPELKWRLQVSDIEELQERQRSLLEAAAELTAPGGELLYAVCSLEPEEGEDLLEEFVTLHPELERAGPGNAFPSGAAGLLTRNGDLRTLPWRDGMDGFFACRLRRAR